MTHPPGPPQPNVALSDGAAFTAASTLIGSIPLPIKVDTFACVPSRAL